MYRKPDHLALTTNVYNYFLPREPKRPWKFLEQNILRRLKRLVVLFLAQSLASSVPTISNCRATPPPNVCKRPPSQTYLGVVSGFTPPWIRSCNNKPKIYINPPLNPNSPSEIYLVMYRPNWWWITYDVIDIPTYISWASILGFGVTTSQILRWMDQWWVVGSPWIIIISCHVQADKMRTLYLF